MASIEYRPLLTIDQLVLRPGTGPTENAPNTANPDNPEFNLDISIHHGLDFIAPTPWVVSNMETTVETPEQAIAFAQYGAIPVIHQFMPIEQRVEIARALSEVVIDKEKLNLPWAATKADGRPLFIMAVGYRDAVTHAKALINAGAPGIRLDSANGYTPGFRSKVADIAKWRQEQEDQIKEIQDSAQGIAQLWAGNVATGDGVMRLAEAGADTVLIGIGSGTGCGTAKFIRVHMAQASALDECALAAKQYGVGIIADGGVREPGFGGIALAFANRGVMMGSTFAATKESAAPKRSFDDCHQAEYYGSASEEARFRRAQKYPNHYTYDDSDPPEGFNGWIPVRGRVKDVIANFNRTLMEQLYYVGVNNLADFRKYAVLHVLSTEAQREVDKGFINNQ